MTTNKRKCIAAVIILLVYWCTYQGTEGTRFFNYISTAQRYTIHYSLVIAAFMAGYWGIKHVQQKWVPVLWVVFYLVFTSIVTAGALLYVFFDVENHSLKNFISGLRMFLSSPVPFGILLFLENKAHKTFSKAKTSETTF